MTTPYKDLTETISLVKATDADVEFLVDLRLQTMQEHLEAEGLFLSDAQHRERVTFKYSFAHIIEIDGQRAGVLKFEETASQIEIYQFQLLPWFQGKGFGKALLGEVLQRAGDKPVRLKVLKNNPAYRLYLSVGFIRHGEDNHEYHLSFAPQRDR